MARGNKYICATCGVEYEYCHKCEFTKRSYDAEHFCSKQHADIFNILSKHGCHLATNMETLEALEGYDLSNLSDNILAHVDSLYDETSEIILDTEGDFDDSDEEYEEIHEQLLIHKGYGYASYPLFFQ